MSESEKKFVKEQLPVLALRGIAVFPGMMLNFDVGRKKSILAIHHAMKNGQNIFLVAQKDIREDEPSAESLFRMGTTAKIKQMIHLPSEGLRVLVEGESRATLTSMSQEEPFFIGEVEAADTVADHSRGLKIPALVRSAQQLVGDYSEVGPNLPQELITTILATENAGTLADYIASNLLMKLEDKQAVLEELHEGRRLELVVHILEREIRILEIENDIATKVHDRIEKNQRDYYLREQMRTLAEELGESDNPQDEAMEYRERIEKLHLTGEVAEKLHKEADRLMRMPAGSHEATVVRGWLDSCLELPWSKSSKEKLDLDYSRRVLERDHYGLQKVKERILEFIAVRKLNPDIRGQIICLVGPPGVGKTSVGRSIARATGRKYVRVSLGGIRDEADIRGHRKTYIGAMPGRIIQAIRQAGTNNPLMLLDEVDKLFTDLHGDPAAALLEVLDPEQNVSFRDHYIELPFDLSRVMFITTANTVDTIPEPLLDRMEVISLSSYTREEKFQIAKQHLLAKQIKRNGLSKRIFKLEDSAIYGLIDSYSREAGVRGLERLIASLCRKAAAKIASGQNPPITIGEGDLESLLGPKKYLNDELPEKDEVGVATGLAWTTVGGETMPVEAAVLDGSGKVELTGSLGDVMKESAQAAISYIRSRVDELHIEKEFYKDKDIHIHVPEGAVPKDGPSAGVTMATALVSALLNLPVRHNLAMTGEITLRGRVLPIGGLKEKTMAAYRAGVKTVIIPKANMPDLAEIDRTVRENIRFVTADSMEKVIHTAILFPEKESAEQEAAEQAAASLPLVDAGRPIPAIRQ